ncbi:hypothetical protein PM082_001542 [Marasmius tenuissimus]|nr:hypothetical protein PM082_001542 [Marasmius tenuissimus]
MFRSSTRFSRQLYLSCRWSSSSSSNSYPFPSQPNPSPHQIFHLPRSASQEEIKERYYELVRIYHPDKNASSESSEQAAHTRFQAISNAYNILRGQTPSGADPVASRFDTMAQQATTASRRAAHIRRHRELYASGAVDDRWKDRLILFGTVAAVVIFVLQAMLTRQEALTETMDRTRSNRIRIRRHDERNTEAREDPRLAATNDENTETTATT